LSLFKVQEEAARQQGASVGKGGPMAPPVMHRHLGVVPNQPNPGGMVGNVGNVSQMGPGGNNFMGNNLLPMDQWGNNRYPNNAVQGIRPPNQPQVMQQNPMQQQQVINLLKFFLVRLTKLLTCVFPLSQ